MEQNRWWNEFREHLPDLDTLLTRAALLWLSKSCWPWVFRSWSSLCALLQEGKSVWNIMSEAVGNGPEAWPWWRVKIYQLLKLPRAVRDLRRERSRLQNEWDETCMPGIQCDFATCYYTQKYTWLFFAREMRFMYFIHRGGITLKDYTPKFHAKRLYFDRAEGVMQPIQSYQQAIRELIPVTGKPQEETLYTWKLVCG